MRDEIGLAEASPGKTVFLYEVFPLCIAELHYSILRPAYTQRRVSGRPLSFGSFCLTQEALVVPAQQFLIGQRVEIFTTLWALLAHCASQSVA